MSGGESFCPRERIRKREEFLRIYREGQRVHRRGFVLHCLVNGLDFDRLGLAVSRRLGGAVVRNRVKRRLREAFRRNKRHLSPGLDLVLTAKTPLADQPYEQVEREYLSALREAGRRRRRGSRPVGPSRSSISTS